jgi:hypothetical protein
MNKKIGKNEASHSLTKTMVKMTVSIMAVILFIGTAIQPALAGTSTTQGIESKPNQEEECNLCAPTSENLPDLPICETCVEAVNFAINYSINYTKVQVEGAPVWYPLKARELTLHFKNGIIKGLAESGFSFKKIDEDELDATIGYWVNLTVGEQTLNRTRFVAYLGAVAIGITGYLLSLCNKEQTKGRAPTITPLMILITKLKSVISRFLIKFHMIRP